MPGMAAFFISEKLEPSPNQAIMDLCERARRLVEESERPSAKDSQRQCHD
jgi:hypothetical protein